MHMKSNTTSNSYKTVLIITVGFLALSFLTDLKVFLYISLSVGVLGAISSYMAKVIDFVWMKLAWLLGLILPNILMALIFFLFLFPFAILSRILHKRDLLKLRGDYKTYYIQRKSDFVKDSFEKIW